MKITTDLSPVDMMIYISTFLNTWEKQLSLKLVNKAWYITVESEEMKGEEKLLIPFRKSLLTQLIEDKSTNPVAADFFIREISMLQGNAVSKSMNHLYLRWLTWALFTGGTAGGIAYLSWCINAIKKILRPLQWQFFDVYSCSQWWQGSGSRPDLQWLFKRCLGMALPPETQNEICYQISLQAQEELCSSNFIGDKAGLSVLVIALFVMLYLCFPSCRLDLNLSLKNLYKNTEIRHKVIDILQHLLGNSFNSFESSTILRALRESYPEETQTPPLKITIHQSELETPFLSQTDSAFFAGQNAFLTTEEQKIHFDSSRTSKCACIIL